MEFTTYHIPVGQMTRPDPVARRAEGDRWVSLRSLRNQPHVSATLEPDASNTSMKAAPTVRPFEHPGTRSIYRSVVQRHERARQLTTANPLPKYAMPEAKEAPAAAPSEEGGEESS